LQIATTKYDERCQIIFPCIGSGQQYAYRQQTINTTVPSPHEVTLQTARNSAQSTLYNYQ